MDPINNINILEIDLKNYIIKYSNHNFIFSISSTTNGILLI